MSKFQQLELTAEETVTKSLKDTNGVTEFIAGAFIMAGVIVQQASVQAALDALTKYTKFDVRTVYFSLFGTCVVVSILLSFFINLYSSGYSSSLLDRFSCCSKSTTVVVLVTLCGIVSAIAQGAFTVGILSLFDGDSPSYNRDVLIVTSCISAGTIVTTGVAVGLVFKAGNGNDETYDRPLALPSKTVLFGMQTVASRSKRALKEAL